MNEPGADVKLPELHPRRRFLAATAVSALGAAGTALWSSGAGAAPATPVFDVTAYGALGDGVTSDTLAIQRAVDEAALRGGVIWFPAGHYRVTSPGIKVTHQVHLQGVGWEPGGANGSWLYCDDASSSVVTIAEDPASPAGPAGTIVRDLALRHLQPDPGEVSFTPTGYPDAIRLGPGSSDVLLENLFLQNPTRGIAVGADGGAVGRIVMRRIWGQPLSVGIALDDCQDTVRISEVHFWPFWAEGPDQGGVGSWQLANGTGIWLGRCDNPMLSEIFCYGYRVGLHLTRGASGNAHKVKLSNADFDKCRTGILASGLQGGIDPHTLINISLQGPDEIFDDDPSAICVEESSGVKLAVLNASIFNFGGGGISISGPGSTLLADNLFIHSVNRGDHEAAGIAAIDGASARVGFQREIVAANDGPATQGRVNLD